jgi:hypothetical protein
MSSVMAARQVSRDRALEMLAVVLLGIATVGSAWCGYQASRWNGEESRRAREAGLARIESSRLFTLAAQKVSYDAMVTAQLAQAVAQGDAPLADFYRNNLVRPEFVPYIEAWRDAVAAGETPPPLVENRTYLDEQLGPSREADAEAQAEAARADDAADNSDDYVLTTLIMASALFFAGVTGSFRAPTVRLALLGAAGIVIAIAASRIVDLPVT